MAPASDPSSVPESAGLFVEIFGAGRLSRLLAARGVPTLRPRAPAYAPNYALNAEVDDIRAMKVSRPQPGGPGQLHRSFTCLQRKTWSMGLPRRGGISVLLWKRLRRTLRRTSVSSSVHGGPLWDSLAGLPARLCVVIEPPRASFLRARDRSARSQLRSPALPWGLDHSSGSAGHLATHLGNSVVHRLREFVRWTAGRGDTCVLVHPADSYLWRLLDDGASLPDSSDYDFTACMFGSPARGPHGRVCLARLI